MTGARAIERMRWSSAATFLAWAVPLVLAIPAALMGGAGLAGAVADLPESEAMLYAPGGGVFIDAVPASIERTGVFATLAWLAALFATAVLTPWLFGTWVSALAAPRTLRDAIVEGARAYLRVLLVTLFLLLVFAGTAIAAALLPVGAHFALGGSPNVRTHDLVVLASLVPGAILLAGWAAWYDLARARAALVAESPLASFRFGARALGATTVGAWFFWFALGLAILWLGWRFAAAVDGAGELRIAAVFAVTQIAALLRTFVRARWLAGVAARVAVGGHRPVGGVDRGQGAAGDSAIVGSGSSVADSTSPLSR